MNLLAECLPKVMQTALAVRDTVLTLADMFVYVIRYILLHLGLGSSRIRFLVLTAIYCLDYDFLFFILRTLIPKL